METNASLTWFLIITIVAGIFQIILFFKIWIMTNDVNTIKNNLNNKGITKQAQIAFLKGNKEEAKNLLYDAIYTSILESAKDYAIKEDYNRDLINIDRIYKPICEKMEIEMINLDQYKDKNNLPI